MANKPKKNKNQKLSFSAPYNVSHRMGIDVNFEWKSEKGTAAAHSTTLHPYFLAISMTYSPRNGSWEALDSIRRARKVYNAFYLIHNHSHPNRGSYGAVFRAKHSSGFEMAIKQIQMDVPSLLLNHTIHNNHLHALIQQSGEELENEIDILKNCNHSNVVNYFGSFVHVQSLQMNSLTHSLTSRRTTISGSWWNLCRWDQLKIF